MRRLAPAQRTRSTPLQARSSRIRKQNPLKKISELARDATHISDRTFCSKEPSKLEGLHASTSYRSFQTRSRRSTSRRDQTDVRPPVQHAQEIQAVNSKTGKQCARSRIPRLAYLSRRFHNLNHLFPTETQKRAPRCLSSLWRHLQVTWI